MLTLLRLLQGFGAGAEFSSAITLNAEKAPAHRRGYYASWSGVGIGCGVLLSALANYSMFSVQAAYFAELFNSARRVTAISMSREISSIFAGGLAPIIASSLLLWSNGNYAAGLPGIWSR